ncbi:hypothetical protein sscle_06g050550 [Sclerotinia sclerotiorum 1980 UF-70]|uniref:Uncharacterized protein n=1 Tax=Sclerotinia sclerotiorum (strain ATCC 18683 / 1980 / Ss-1) TaxID=665079 RepID=A0A1D9Q5S7_SCLS1|nr:hypothetical protein sscle_06g050550 [Sclerotinia sclerotiorum 1980 UF-70]
MDPAAEKAFESLIQDQESVEVIFGKAKEMIWNDFAKGAGEAMMFKLLEPFAGLGELENCIKILLGMLNEEAAVLRNTGQTNTLQSLAVEIRRGIFHCLLVNLELEEASSISQLGSYGAKIRYGLSPQILLVCRLFHQERREIPYGSNRFYVKSLPLFGLEPPLTLCSPLTRWSNQRDEEDHYLLFNKGLLQGNPVPRQVKKWKLVLSAKYHSRRSQTQLFEWCISFCEHQTPTGGSFLTELDICIIPKGVETNDNFVVVEFVKREKRIRVIFDLTRVNDLFFDLNVHTEAIVVLEEYVASFYRELDTTTKRHVRAQHGRFELRYNSMPREVRLEQCRIAYKMGMLLVFENIFAQQLAEEEAGIDVPEDIEDESFIDEEEIYGMDIQNNADGVSEDDLVDMENPNIEMAGWISLPFFNEDDCFSSIYQMDDNQFHLPSTHTAAVGTDEASETNYFEALFRDDESLSSQYEDDEDDDDDDDDDEEEIAESTQAHINSDDSILHVDVWLEESQSSLSHAFPWLADLQD